MPRAAVSPPSRRRSTPSRPSLTCGTAEVKMAARIHGSFPSRRASRASASPAQLVVQSPRRSADLEPDTRVGVAGRSLSTCLPTRGTFAAIGQTASITAGICTTQQWDASFAREGHERLARRGRPRSASVQIACTRVVGLRENRHCVWSQSAQLAQGLDRFGVAACAASSRWAVSRCQPLGLSMAATSPPGVELVETRDRTRLLVDRIDPVDPPLLAAGAEVEPLFPVVGNPFRVLDHVAVHVGDPERTVRPGLEHRRPEPVVARGQELAVSFVGDRDARESVTPSGSSTIRWTRLCTGSLTKRLGFELGAEQVVAIRRRAVGRGDAVGLLEIVESRKRPADRDRAACRARVFARGSGGA